MKFTEFEIEILIDLLREGRPLPDAYKDRIVFESDNREKDDELDSQQPLIPENLMGLIGSDLKRRGLFGKIRTIASSNIPVLIEGEGGTGKKLAARTIHEMSTRANKPFIIVNCNSMSEDLSESQLLGHEKGAFTGAVTENKGLIEMANQGTIVFDEVDALTHKAQALLLQYLENETIKRLGGNKQIYVDARVIATSDKDLKVAVKEGCFRDDLYFHISSVTLSMIPLRERLNDILILANFFLQKYAKQNQKRLRFSSQAIGVLLHHMWFGNVTELEHRIKGAVVMANGRKINPEDLGFENPLRKDEYAGMTLKEAREQAERNIINHVLIKYANNISKAATELGISRPTLYELTDKLKIPKP
jgi:two-component system, NtrC family, response regulator